MNLATIPPSLPFLDTVAARWLAAAEPGLTAAADGLILVPTRRAARGLTEAFLRQSAGRPMLLPRIAALGGLDEAPLALAGALDVPPPIPAETRLAVLARMVMALPAAFGAPTTADRAWPLAAELAALLDEAARAELDLAANLPEAADPGFAEHWQQTLEFLQIVTRFWPEFLAGSGFSDRGAHALALLRAQARAWEDSPPPEPVWVAGTTGAIPAVASLLRVVARLPRGLVVLPGLDLDMPDTAWEALTDSHPQVGMQRLLAGLGATRGDVARWGEPALPGREATLNRALLPAAALSAWQSPFACDLSGLLRIKPADQQEEAVAIALILRETLETPGARAALVTPDRDLAARVSGELARFGVAADDSAGEPLGETPQAIFLRLIASVVTEDLAPVPLLGLLKHPLAGVGLAPAACRAAGRDLERLALRGPRPPGGVAGLRERLQAASGAGDARHLLDRLEPRLAPLLTLAATPSLAPLAWLDALVAAAEALAGTDAEPGAARLWSGEEGEALALHLAALREGLAHLPPQPPATLPALFEASLEGKVVRGRRALRRSGAAAEHPRIFIWGLLEARLQSVDRIVLGGLAEGVWPAATEPGPWMSRPMRARIGLPAAEERIGQMAHDFATIACAAPEVILSCPRRRDGAPAVPARWLARLDAMLAGQNQRLPEHPAVAWARALDQPDGPPRPVRPPAPCPPVGLRPRRLSITAIETWRRDPYAIYARHILGLEALPPLEEDADAADYGSIVHAALHAFLRSTGAAWPADARARLRAAMEQALADAHLRPALNAWWRPRLLRIAAWLADHERDRRAGLILDTIHSEISGSWEISGLRGCPFTLHGRADRIERRIDGSLGILDYKTGYSPKRGDIESGYAPQLLIEALMAEAGAFRGVPAGRVAELIYWELPGGFEPGRVVHAVPKDLAGALVMARDGLRNLIECYDEPDRPYLSRPHPDAAPRFSDYAQLARLAEWEAAGDGG